MPGARKCYLDSAAALWDDSLIMEPDPLPLVPTATLAAACGAALLARGWRLAVAESCTGGRLGDCVTNLAGSSAWFAGGVIAYADAVKIRLLGVPAALIATHGAVSAPVAAAMAQGAQRGTGAEVALAVTGIAGPDGGTPTKPVGTVFLGLATPTGVQTLHRLWPGDRLANKEASVAAALQLLLAYLSSE